MSRAELQQKLMNDMDNMLRGMRAGPHRVDGKVEGFKLFQLAPTNMLYRLGARTGDVIKRINGHPIDSTEKLYRMWQTFPKESRVQVDIERGSQNITFDITISD
jgi:general secretion pathway protein C